MIGLAVHMTSLSRGHGCREARPVGWVEDHMGEVMVYDRGRADV